MQLDVSDLRVKKTSFEFNFAARLIDLGMTQPEEPARLSLRGGSDTARESQGPAPSTAQPSSPSWSSCCPRFALPPSLGPAAPCILRQCGSRRGCACAGVRLGAVLPQHQCRWCELQGMSWPWSRSAHGTTGSCSMRGCTMNTAPCTAVLHTPHQHTAPRTLGHVWQWHELCTTRNAPCLDAPRTLVLPLLHRTHGGHCSAVCAQEGHGLPVPDQQDQQDQQDRSRRGGAAGCLCQSAMRKCPLRGGECHCWSQDCGLRELSPSSRVPRRLPAGSRGWNRAGSGGPAPWEQRTSAACSPWALPHPPPASTRLAPLSPAGAQGKKRKREREGGKEKLKNLSSLINEASQPGEHVWDRRPPARGEPAARAGDMEEERWGGMGGDRHGFLYSPVN